jgi:hypothetical protein
MIDPWLSRTGAPRVVIPRAVVERTESDWDLFVLLAQGAPAYPLDVPITIRTTTGDRSLRVPLSTERDAATITLKSKPLSVTADPDFQLWRQLAPGESPPILREAIAAREPVIVTLDSSPDFKQAAETLGKALLEHPARIASTLPADAPVVILVGTPERIAAALARNRLGARPGEAKVQGTAQAWTVRKGNQTVLVISAKDADALAALSRTLPHLGGQSWAVFEGPRPLARGVWKAEATKVPVRKTSGK